jgi:hypothetical protein
MQYGLLTYTHLLLSHSHPHTLLIIMLHYQSETTVLLQTELCIAHSRRIGYIKTPTRVPRSREVLAEFMAYEGTVAARLKLSVELDRKTNPKKYSGLGLSVRQMRYTRVIKEQAAPLDAALDQYRQTFGVYMGWQWNH